MRAGFGIYLSMERVIKANNFPVKIRYFDGSTTFDNATWVRSVLEGADVILIGAETWSQGPSYYSRRFFEVAGGVNLGGVYGSAWASSGGYHTGGEVTISTNLRSLMGMGANVYTMGQKLMDFTTDERLDPPPGEFSLFDVWYMDQFAKYTLAVGIAGDDSKAFKSLCEQLGCNPFYYMHSFPPNRKALKEFIPLQKRLNKAADNSSKSYEQLTALFLASSDSG